MGWYKRSLPFQICADRLNEMAPERVGFWGRIVSAYFTQFHFYRPCHDSRSYDARPEFHDGSGKGGVLGKDCWRSG